MYKLNLFSFEMLLNRLGRPRRNGKPPGRKTVLWETVAWETACWPYPGQTDARLRLGSGVGLSSITEFSFNLSLTRCIKNTGQQERHPATSSSQSDSDTPTSCLSQVFALKNPVLRTTEQVLTSLGWPHFAPSLNLPWLAPLSFLFSANKPCSLAHCVRLVSWATPT